jgi:hypothetical protein
MERQCSVVGATYTNPYLTVTYQQMSINSRLNFNYACRTCNTKMRPIYQHYYCICTLRANYNLRTSYYNIRNVCLPFCVSVCPSIHFRIPQRIHSKLGGNILWARMYAFVFWGRILSKFNVHANRA